MLLVKTASRQGLRNFRRVSALRFISNEPKEVFTRLNDRSDPARNPFFQYTWGSWLKNNTLEKARRETRFNIENLSSFFKTFKVQPSTLVKPHSLPNGITTLPHNWTAEILGESKHNVKAIASVHEGKHHRVYKITMENEKNLVLRIPYKLESDSAIENKIKSEVATIDFLAEKLHMPVPKVVAYGVNRLNALQTPFILMEHIEGDLLMKKWNPLQPDSDSSVEELKLVIAPIMNFMDESLEITFTSSGSLYFFDDVKIAEQANVPYDGESNNDLKDRWRIGPSVERCFSRNKKHLSPQQVRSFSGPWDQSDPLKVITDLASLHLESLRTRLGLAQADSANQVENVNELKKQIETFEHLKTMSTKLFNPKSTSIMNVEEMFKPRLYLPDLDPLNVIIRDGKPVFVDFEHTCIKPFIFTTYPSFVAYQGAKIFNLEEEIPEFETLDEVEQEQYRFMYYKTRNERLWEHALNEKRHDLISIASPHVKVLKAPYSQALECKNDKDYLFVENAIIQLQAMWNVYVANGMVNVTDPIFPIEYTQEQLDENQAFLDEYQNEIVSLPFAATGGWIPQDMFAVLKEQGILVEDKHGNFRVEKEAALKDAPQEGDK